MPRLNELSWSLILRILATKVFRVNPAISTPLGRVVDLVLNKISRVSFQTNFVLCFCKWSHLSNVSPIGTTSFPYHHQTPMSVILLYFGGSVFSERQFFTSCVIHQENGKCLSYRTSTNTFLRCHCSDMEKTLQVMHLLTIFVQCPIALPKNIPNRMM